MADDETQIITPSAAKGVDAEDQTRIGSPETQPAYGPDSNENLRPVGQDVDDHTKLVTQTGRDELTSLHSERSAVVGDIETKTASNSDSVSSRNDMAEPNYRQQRIPQTNSRNPSIGSTIRDRFVLEGTLGAGGMGTVYRALDIRKQEARDSQPHIAIKLLSKEIAEHPSAFRMLQRETRKSQQLAHPNIITVFDFDRDGDIIYMTMEELQGETLDTLISRHPNGVAADEVKHIIDGITQGLSYAHSKNIIHSDLKPSNVFLTDEGVVKLLDFGIARAVSSSAGASSDTQFDAEELGGLTPTYASVDMFAGEDPMPSDDVFALGLIAYELITGLHPYGRAPAPKALSEQRRADKPNGLTKRQWRAVSGAISFTERNRITSVTDFQRLYLGKPRVLIAAVSASLLVVSTAIATVIFAPTVEPVAVPFDTLPLEAQNTVTANLEDARVALNFSDINAAIHHLSVVNEFHRHNPTAQDLADRLVNNALAQMAQLDAGSELDRIETLLSYDVLKDNEQLRDRFAELTAQ